MGFAVRILCVLMLSASVPSAGESGPVPAPVPLQLNWRDPGNLQIDFLRTPEIAGLPAIHNAMPAGPGRDTAPAKLFDNGNMSFRWSADGRFQYRLNVTNPLDAGLGAQVNGNSARLTLTWPRRK
jgi:hypothetical protein